MQGEVNILFTVLASAVFALLMVVFITVFLLVSQKRSFKYQKNMQEMEKKHESAILNAQIEVQTSTLQQVSEEIHDNIGQLLSVTKLNLSSISKQATDEMQPLIDETKNVVNDIISELRYLSKSISAKHISDFGLAEAIGYQVSRINKSKQVQTHLDITGTPKQYNPRVELVLFRMVQELLNNALKHSRCHNIFVKLIYDNSRLSIIVRDDGTGFEIQDGQARTATDGSGLYHLGIKARSINCDLEINSNHEGTKVRMIKHFNDGNN